MKIIRSAMFFVLAVAILTLVSCDDTAKERKLLDEDSPRYEIPAVYTNISYDDSGILTVEVDGKSIPVMQYEPFFVLAQARGKITGSDKGLDFDFLKDDLQGVLYYGFIPDNGRIFSYPIYFKRSATISGGKASVDISYLKGKYDIIDWQKRSGGKLGYRVVASDGRILYDGKINFTGTGPFEPAPSIIEGPFLNQVTDSSCVISYETNVLMKTKIRVGDRLFEDETETLSHEILLSGFEPSTEYAYEVFCGAFKENGSFETAPKKGSRKEFEFGFASDCRAGAGGGERNLGAVNGYILKRIAALALEEDVAFWQFTGDLISGYRDSHEETLLEYANFKRIVEPFAKYVPVYVAQGNHESVNYTFADGETEVQIDRFPFAKYSAEQAFARSFVNYKNGPKSEDGSALDPNPDKIDFPSYEENVYYYEYANTAMIVLNSNYFYAPSEDQVGVSGGNPHAYIMDNQLKWFRETLERLEKDPAIDHVFVTFHTPMFPNGGHVDDDMWYSGDNSIRPYAAGKPAERGIIERRDDLLDAMCNRSSKVRAVLCGDEHNYSRTLISDDTPRYPDDWDKEKVELRRPIWQITNGSAGAPYYGMQRTPWSDFVKTFSTQYALVIFEIDGPKIEIEVLNPDTLEEIEEAEL